MWSIMVILTKEKLILVLTDTNKPNFGITRPARVRLLVESVTFDAYFYFSVWVLTDDSSNLVETTVKTYTEKKK